MPRPRLLIGVTRAETGGAQMFVHSLVDGLRGEDAIAVAAQGPHGAVADEYVSTEATRTARLFRSLLTTRRAPSARTGHALQ